MTTIFVSAGGSSSDVAVTSGRTLYASAGYTSSGLELTAGDSLVVGSGDTAIATTIDDNGVQYVNLGGVAISTTVNRGGEENVGLYTFRYLGGITSFTTVNDGGQENLESGGTSYSATVNSGGQEGVAFGGTAIGTTVNGGGQLVLGGNATSADNFGVSAISTTVNSGGTLVVYDGADAFATNFRGGTEILSSGATVSGATVAGAGLAQLALSAGGSAISTTVNSGGVEYVDGGGMVIGTTVNSGGQEDVTRGGTAIATAVNGGGTLSVGGDAISTAVNSGGTLVLYLGADTSATTFRGGTEVLTSAVAVSGTSVAGGALAQLALFSGGSAISTPVNSGGDVYVGSGGVAISTTVNSAGYAFVSSGGVAVVTAVNSGGDEDVASGGSEIDTTVNSGGLLDLQEGSAVDGGIIFGPAGGTVEIDSTSLPTGVISNFAASSASGLQVSDTIDLAATQANDLVFDTSDGVLTLYDADWGTGAPATEVGSLTFGGYSYPPAFALSSDGEGGTDVTFGTPTPTPAILAGLSNAVYTPDLDYGTYDVVNSFSDSADGFFGEAFQSGSQIVVAFRGTDLSNFSNLTNFWNLVADGSWLLSTPDATLEQEVTDGADFLNEVRLDNTSDSITLTGHSLGGAIAQLLGEASDYAATGFDAPGAEQFVDALSAQDFDAFLVSDGIDRTDDNYRLYGDQVSLHGTPIGPQYTVQNPNPNADTWLSAIPNHSIATLAQQLSLDAPFVTPDTALPFSTLIPTVILSTAAGIIRFSLSAVIQAVSTLFAIEPTAASEYQLAEDAPSPNLSAVVLPSFPEIGTTSVAAFNLSVEIGGTWRSDGSVTPDATLSLPGGVAGIEFAAVDGGGNPIAMPDGFTFGVEFASTGTLNGILTESVACFADGSRILTGRGEVPIETVQVGERVVTLDGFTQPVIWLGHRRIDCRRHPRPRDVWPVRISAHAFGEGRPQRDLMLSPDHAVFLDGVLIPIRYLINGTTIVQTPVDRVTYWHVELDRHAVILAEGLPCESYLDTGNRAAFDDGGGPVMLHPDFARRVWEAKACVPLIMGGPPLILAKRRVHVQATLLGHARAYDENPERLPGSPARHPRAALRP